MGGKTAPLSTARLADRNGRGHDGAGDVGEEGLGEKTGKKIAAGHEAQPLAILIGLQLVDAAGGGCSTSRNGSAASCFSVALGGVFDHCGSGGNVSLAVVDGAGAGVIFLTSCEAKCHRNSSNKC